MQVTQRRAAQCMQGCGATEEEVLMSAWHLGEGAWNGGRERLGGSRPSGRTGRTAVEWRQGARRCFLGQGAETWQL